MKNKYDEKSIFDNRYASTDEIREVFPCEIELHSFKFPVNVILNCKIEVFALKMILILLTAYVETQYIHQDILTTTGNLNKAVVSQSVKFADFAENIFSFLFKSRLI